MTYENILITGASNGIGAAVAIRFAQLGAKHLFLCGRNAARLAETAEKIRMVNSATNVHTAVLDVADPAATREWIFSCDALAPLDLVYANAGVSTGGKEDDEEAVRNVFSINLTGVLNTVYPAIEIFSAEQKPGTTHFRARHIAITASLTGYHGMPQCPAYSASKTAVKALGFALRGRLAPRGIRVSTVCPGFVRSAITDQNTCPMPFFWESDRAAKRICAALLKNRGTIAFPWPMRLCMWVISSLPDALSERIFRALPEKN